MILYVSPNGNDMADGSPKTPLASFLGAKNRVRGLIEAGLKEPVTVLFAPGEYRVTETTFDAADSGTETCPVTYASEEKGKAILNGGVALDPAGFGPISDEVRACLHGEAREKVVCFDLKKLGVTRAEYGEMCVIGSHNTGFMYDGAVTSPMWCELFCNGARQTIARYPSEGFLRFGDPIREGQGWGSGTGAGIEHDIWVKMRNPIPDIYGIDPETAARGAKWKYTQDLWMFGYPMHDWADMSTPIVKIDAEACSMEAKYVSMFGIKNGQSGDEYHNGGRYYLYNVLDELDTPGEWYLDRDHAILYFYPPCDLKDADVKLSLATQPILSFKDASHLTFKGFTVTGTRADAIGGTCAYLTVDSCFVCGVAGSGIILNGSHISVKNCEVTHTGRGGITVSGGDRATLTPGHILIENNHIHHFSEIYKTYQVGVSVGGVGNVARHNEIDHTPHMAISCGGNDNLVELNYIHDAVTDSTDGGAFYSGRSWNCYGNVIRYNKFKNIGGEGFRPDGIYWDDGMSGQTAYGNILIGIPKHSFLVGGGRENVVDHNLIVSSGDSALEYDDRMYDGYFRQGWARGAVEIPNGCLWGSLREMPYTSEIWAAKYPRLAVVHTESTTDSTDPDFPAAPAYSSVCGNVIVAPRGSVYQIADSVYRFSEVKDNRVYATAEEAGWDPVAENLRPDSPVFRDMPDFKAIPADKIGLYPVEYNPLEPA